MPSEHSTEYGQVVSCRQVEDPRITGELRVGDDVMVEFEPDGLRANARLYGEVEEGEATEGGHEIKIEVCRTVDCAAVMIGDEIIVRTGVSETGRMAPVVLCDGDERRSLGEDAYVWEVADDNSDHYREGGVGERATSPVGEWQPPQKPVPA